MWLVSQAYILWNLLHVAASTSAKSYGMKAPLALKLEAWPRDRWCRPSSVLSIDHLGLHPQEGVSSLARSAQSRAGLQATHSGTLISETRFPDNPFPPQSLWNQLCLKKEKMYMMTIGHLEQKCSGKESLNLILFSLSFILSHKHPPPFYNDWFDRPE